VNALLPPVRRRRLVTRQGTHAYAGSDERYPLAARVGAVSETRSPSDVVAPSDLVARKECSAARKRASPGYDEPSWRVEANSGFCLDEAVLLDVDLSRRTASRRKGSRLSDFQLDERGFQEVLFNSLDRLFPDEDLLLLMQSRYWREEPDLLALDAEGRLYIFELKAWESREENLLQALRYGQIFGQYDYDQLAGLYATGRVGGQDLAEAHAAKFDVQLTRDRFNRDQVFVVMTNGLDVRTRQGIRYWRNRGLDVQPWVYRVYPGAADASMLVEMNPFGIGDDPYEDVVSNFYVLNTNYGNNPADDSAVIRPPPTTSHGSTRLSG
jgi:hypothetical protein